MIIEVVVFLLGFISAKLISFSSSPVHNTLLKWSNNALGYRPVLHGELIEPHKQYFIGTRIRGDEVRSADG